MQLGRVVYGWSTSAVAYTDYTFKPVSPLPAEKRINLSAGTKLSVYTGQGDQVALFNSKLIIS